MSDSREHYVCSCGSLEHTFVFSYDNEEKELVLSVYLNQYRSFFQRLLVALKYVLGYKCKYGHWDTVLLSTEETQKLHNQLSKVVNKN